MLWLFLHAQGLGGDDLTWMNADLRGAATSFDFGRQACGRIRDDKVIDVVLRNNVGHVLRCWWRALPFYLRIKFVVFFLYRRPYIFNDHVVIARDKILFVCARAWLLE